MTAIASTSTRNSGLISAEVSYAALAGTPSVLRRQRSQVRILSGAPFIPPMFQVVFPRLSAFGGQVDGINDAAPGTPALGADPVYAGNAEQAQRQPFGAVAAARVGNFQVQRQPAVDRAEDAAGLEDHVRDGGAGFAEGADAGCGLERYEQQRGRIGGGGGNRGGVR